MIIIGTTALDYYGIKIRDPSDIDVMVPVDSVGKYKEDYDVVPVSQRLYNKLNKYLPIIGKKFQRSIYATPDMVYTIKCSHLGWNNPKWEKHKKDILTLKHKGCKILPDLYRELIAWWREDLGDKAFLSLDKTKEQFFTDRVVYVYDHDYLHTLVSYPNRPLYEKCLQEGKEVLIDKQKFFSLPFDQQIKMFKEEIYTIALERWFLTGYWQERGISWLKSYQLALKKTITNLTKGWATDFIVENLEFFIKPEYNVFESVVRQLNKEKIMSKYLQEEGVNLIKEIYLAAVEEKVSDHLTDPEDVVDWDDYLEAYFRENIIENWFLPSDFKYLAQEGGGEGGAEDCFCVFSWKGQCYRVDYNYYSYHGYDNLEMSQIYKVEPKEKTIFVYE